MRTSDFNFDLPEAQIAQFPLPERAASRLLYLPAAAPLGDLQFTDVASLLRPGDLLVLNNTRVMAARLFAQKETGGKVEILIERLTAPDTVLAHVRASKSPKPGSLLRLEAGEKVEMVERVGQLFRLRLQQGGWLDAMAEHGHMPLPPYITRDDESLDESRYQTVFSRHIGAVAAPTAGLHFDEAMLQRIADLGVETTEVTLHVGAGTFQPVRAEMIDDHELHAEWVEVTQQTVDAVAACKARGGRVVGVGTTSVRSLESAARDGELKPMSADTRLFIKPGYQFNVIDALITNFHLPESTLLMLVSAFAGYEPVMAAYRHAVATGYRFFSYGDAMFIEKSEKS